MAQTLDFRNETQYNTYMQTKTNSDFYHFLFWTTQ